MQINIPATLTVGDTSQWSESIDSYRPSDGFNLSYVFAGGNLWQLVGTSNQNNGFDFNITEAISNQMVIGIYYWQLVATKPDFRQTVFTGRIKVNANLATVTAPLDNRTEAERTLEKVTIAYEAALISSSYKIGDREKESQNIDSLLNQVRYWRNRVYMERLASGEIQDSRYAKVRFTLP